MAKTPKKPAAKRGGKKPAKKVTKKTAEANRQKQRKPTKKARNSALPHRDMVSTSFSGADPAFARALEAQGMDNFNGDRLPKHPTVEEQYREDAARQAARAAQLAAAAMTPKPHWWTRFRSSVTGLFTTPLFAKRHPRTTEGEKVER